ncbi:MAG: hypothetical protein L7U83_02225 [Akkermansiaceae bacterium]|nr:hypothetical protein [Akkermansiaceae bacterium]
MKKILLTTFAMVLPFLAISCADYGTYGYGTVATPVRSSGSSVIVGGLAPLQVGFVATSFDRWAWDPYRRHYFDRSCRRYWSPRSRGYCSVTPVRFSSPIYPTGFRRGHRLSCPTYLPRHSAVAIHRGDSHRSVGAVSSRGKYAPVIHGQSHGVVSLRPSSYSTSTRSSSSRTVTRSSLNQTSAPGRTSSQSTQRPSSSSRYQTVSSAPSRTSSQPTQRPSSSSRHQMASSAPSRPKATPVVRSSSYTPRSTSSRSPVSTSASSSPSRSTSSPSRSVSRARQKTR